MNIYIYSVIVIGGPGAPFKNHYHLHEEYKTAVKKYVHVMLTTCNIISSFTFRYELVQKWVDVILITHLVTWF